MIHAGSKVSKSISNPHLIKPTVGQDSGWKTVPISSYIRDTGPSSQGKILLASMTPRVPQGSAPFYHEVNCDASCLRGNITAAQPSHVSKCEITHNHLYIACLRLFVKVHVMGERLWYKKAHKAQLSLSFNVWVSLPGVGDICHSACFCNYSIFIL